LSIPCNSFAIFDILFNSSSIPVGRIYEIKNIFCDKNA
jgi:hypothetical protein